MPRQRRRDQSGRRWKRRQARLERDRNLGIARDPNHQRIHVDSLEFASLFTVVGGRAKIGDAIVRAFDCNGRRPRSAVAPRILDIERDKASKLMAKARDAAAIRRAKEKLRQEQKQSQIDDLLTAYEHNLFVWRRQEVPDQKLRSVLVGSNAGKDPTRESDSLVICFKADDGRYYIGEETWHGGWSTADGNGFRERIDVCIDVLQNDDGTLLTFADESEAHRAIKLAAHMGELERFEDQKSADYVRRHADRLRIWHHDDHDMKRIYGRE